MEVVMKIEQRSIDEIRPYDGNPRGGDAAVDAVAASLREFGFRQPMIVAHGALFLSLALSATAPWKSFTV